MSKALTYSIFESIIPKTLSKSDKRKIEIIHAAIKSYSKLDYDYISYDDIAKNAKTNRKLVQHYFPNKSDLFEISMKFIRAYYQKTAIDAFSKATSPLEEFKAYLFAALNWVELEPSHVKAWIVFFLMCSQKKEFKKLHIELTTIGHNRIIDILKKLNTNIDEKQISIKAKIIQRLITGSIIEMCTEKETDEFKNIYQDILNISLKLIDLNLSQ